MMTEPDVEKGIQALIQYAMSTAAEQGVAPKFDRKQRKALRIWHDAEELAAWLAQCLRVRSLDDLPPSPMRPDSLRWRVWLRAMDLGGRAHAADGVGLDVDRIEAKRAKARRLFPRVAEYYTAMMRYYKP